MGAQAPHQLRPLGPDAIVQLPGLAGVPDHAGRQQQEQLRQIQDWINKYDPTVAQIEQTLKKAMSN